MSERELLFSVTADDCRWDYFKGSGKGGQKRNKTESGVRCTHKDSGAVGVSDDTRSQHKNKQTAFVRMSQTKEFENWHKTEVARTTGELLKIEEKIKTSMKLSNLLIEGRVNGKWDKIDSVSN